MKRDLQEAYEDKLYEKLKGLPEFVFDFISFLGESKEIQTRIEYAKDIRIFLEYLIHSGVCIQKNIESITPEDLDSIKERHLVQFFQYITRHDRIVGYKNGEPITRRFRNGDVGKSRKLATIRKLFSYLFRLKQLNQDVSQNLEIKVKKKDKVNTRLNPTEITQFMETILEDEAIISNRSLKFHEKVKFRDYIMTVIMAYTGIRVSELVQLDIDDIELYEETMVVTRKGGDEQKLDIPKRIMEDISEYVNQRKNIADVDSLIQPALFLSLRKKRIDAKTVRYMLDKYAVRAGITKKVTPHVFRRTFGTDHYNKHGDMYLTAAILGHESAETTRRFYAQPNQARITKSMKDYDHVGEERKKSIDLKNISAQLGISEQELAKRLFQ